MKPIALVTTKPGFEPQLRDELNKLPINKKILWTPFRGILKVLSESPHKFLEVIKENKNNLKFLLRVIPLEVKCQTDINEIKKAYKDIFNSNNSISETSEEILKNTNNKDMADNIIKNVKNELFIRVFKYSIEGL